MLHESVEARQAELRLRAISEEILELRKSADFMPGHQLLIDLLEMERATIKELYIKAVPCSSE